MQDHALKVSGTSVPFFGVSVSSCYLITYSNWDRGTRSWPSTFLVGSSLAVWKKKKFQSFRLISTVKSKKEARKNERNMAEDLDRVPTVLFNYQTDCT